MVIERAGVHFCPNVFIVDYRNVSALLSNLLSKKGNEGASDQVFMVFIFGPLIASQAVSGNKMRD
jgi:hypothetical protein